MTRQHSAQAKTIESAQSNTQAPIARTPAAHSMLHLQHQVGNQAATAIVQAKLTVGEPNDRYEQEADRVAAQVVRQIHTPTQPTAQRPSQANATPQIQPLVQCKGSTGGMEVSADVEAGIQQARSSGQPLPQNLRASMEQAFGADFSGVRVHTSTQSDQLNQSIQAKAFTTGQDIFFRQGEYQPESQGGQELIAHELTHVMQQNDETVIQRVNVEKVPEKLPRQEKHIIWGDFYWTIPPEQKVEGVPVIIEVLEYDVDSAIAKLNAVKASQRDTKNPIAFIFGLNAPIGQKNKDSISKYGKDEIKRTMQNLVKCCQKIAFTMEQKGIAGGCIPIGWAPTDPDAEGYIFPFLEMRSILTLHPGVHIIHEAMSNGAFPPVVRGMDADVTHDPLLTAKGSNSRLDAGKVEKSLQKGLQGVSNSETSLFSGGYEWDTDEIRAKLTSLNLVNKKRMTPELITYLEKVVSAVNFFEQRVRIQLSEELGHQAIYWPEPNVYTSLTLRKEGAESARDTVRVMGDKEAQQKESTHLVNQNLAHAGLFDQRVSTRKPLKNYFNAFLTFFTNVFLSGNISEGEIREQIVSIRQTHLNIQIVKDILKWQNFSSNPEKAESIVEKYLQQCIAEIVKGSKKLRQES